MRAGTLGRMYSLPNHFSPEVASVTSAHVVSRPHLAAEESGYSTHVLRKVGNSFGELTVVPAMELHCSKSLKLILIKPVHPRVPGEHQARSRRTARR